MSNKVIAVLRDKRYCPKGIQVDADILEAVAERIKVDTFINEAQLTPNHLTTNTTLVLSMGRLPETIAMLKTSQANGAIVVNAPSAVEICTHRTRLHQVMQACGVALPPEQGAQSWWLKRGDADAHESCDVVFCENDARLLEAQNAFRQRGITEWVVSPHVEGTGMKFYGVGHHFFRCYTDEGKPVGAGALGLDLDALHKEVLKIVDAVKIDVYGGDCIVAPGGHFYIIDFNDWPSFRYCKDEASLAIVNSLMHYEL